MSTILPALVSGEALFDFIATEIGYGLGGSRTFQKRVGGSPFNIAVGVRRLGVPVSFLGKIGVDRFGDGLIEFLKTESIDVTHVVRGKARKRRWLSLLLISRENPNSISIAIMPLTIRFELMNCGMCSPACFPFTTVAESSLPKKKRRL